MYPIDAITWWQVLVGVIVLFLVALWVFMKDGQPASIGLMALPISMATVMVWFAQLPEWTAWLVIIFTGLLFVLGMFMPETKDGRFHYGAMIVALFGKLIIWTLPWVWRVLSGQVEVPFWVLLSLILLSVIGITGWRSERTRDRFSRIGNFFGRRRTLPATA